MSLKLERKSFSFQLLKSLKTSKFLLKEKKGWLIKVSNPEGTCGWGEIAPIDPDEMKRCDIILKTIATKTSREELEEKTIMGPGSLGFGIGCALAELDN